MGGKGKKLKIRLPRPSLRLQLLSISRRTIVFAVFPQGIALFSFRMLQQATITGSVSTRLRRESC
jgi:hypothetical protein